MGCLGFLSQSSKFCKSRRRIYKETSFFSTTPFDSSCLCFRTNTKEEEEEEEEEAFVVIFLGKGAFGGFCGALFESVTCIYISNSVSHLNN